MTTARSIPAQFEQQVAAAPDALAIAADDVRLTYGLLDEAANRIAGAILDSGSNTDTVAVLMEHGPSAVAAMLGVMKAGKIFVPLNPRQPSARLLAIVESCEARLLVADRSGMTLATALFPRGFALIDADGIENTRVAVAPGLSISPDARACILYTSGSTGVPKGVVLTHANLLHRTRVYTDLFQLRPSDKLTVLAPCSVAQGLSSILQALANGASLHPFALGERGVGELTSWLRAHGITIFVCTASTFRHFAQTLTENDVFASVRVIRLGSEEIFPHDVALYRRHFPRSCRLVASLGSTEAGAIATNVITHDTDIGDVVPLGHAASGVTVRILDDSGRDCLPGTSGEIAVQSAYVSPGYWRDPARTAEVFIDAPDGSGRYFRTGDIGLVRPDGYLEFKGRKNLCVKIRGFRVELEEIERSLCTHAMVQEVAVVARREQGGEHRLAACLVARPQATLAASDLRAHVREMLPEHMIPATFEFFTALPRTASGKVDRTALASLRTGQAEAGDSPRCDEIQATLMTVWEALLEHRPAAVTDNFFELGGNSLLAARLGVAIERVFGIRLPLAAFLTAATIEEQAALIRRRHAGAWSAIVPVRTGTRPPLFLAHLVDGQVLSYRELIRELPTDQPVYGIQSRGHGCGAAIHTRIEDMAREYVAEIQKQYPCGPLALCGWSFGGIVAFEMARQFEREGRTVDLVALLDTRVRRSEHGGRRLLARLPGHVSAIIEDRTRWSRKVRTAGVIITNALWRGAMLWHRAGGWLPRAMMDITQANRNARRDYVPGTYRGRVTLFHVAQASPHGSDSHAAWMRLALGGLDLHEVPGTHRTMVFAPHVNLLGARLTACLEDAWARAGVMNGDGKAA